MVAATPKAIGIILAGGSGNRFEADVPKQFCLLNGRMVIEHSAATFRESGLFAKLIVVLPPEWIDNPRAAVGDVNVLGGATRNESTWRALEACDPDTDVVLIHDAARPFVSPEILGECVEALRTHDAVDVCIPADDTIVRVDDGFIESIPDRSRLMRGQTPQGFRFSKIVAAYRANLDRLNTTDDVSIYLREGGRCKVVPGSPFNLKLTYPQDLFIAERVLQYRPARPLETLNLRGKHVLLLGGSGGIGRVILDELRRQQAEVCAPTHEEFDLTRDTVPAALERRWDAIIHSAGILNDCNDVSGVEDVFATNFKSVVLITDLARRCMCGGAVVVVGSSSAMKGRAGFPLYSASKAAVNNFVEGIAPLLLQERGVRINCINPGCVNTRMISGAPVTNKTPLEPNEVASIILAYTQPRDTGQIINIRKYMTAGCPIPAIADSRPPILQVA